MSKKIEHFGPFKTGDVVIQKRYPEEGPRTVITRAEFRSQWGPNVLMTNGMPVSPSGSAFYAQGRPEDYELYCPIPRPDGETR